MAHALVTIKNTCLHGGKDGKILHAQEFPAQPGTLWYWVVIAAVHPTVGYWYREDCITVNSGKLPTHDKVNAKRYKVEKSGNVALFDIDKSTHDVLVAEGYTVTLDA